ncbi:MAG: hypothetical protein FD122_952 [Stygiobacter sp.]|nr:MAG: hypothetical protein FD122_952 [Stygiobacter sp.]KAF0217838.1 MAG: hypothetical protein FD178_372 [Ignavibacteria bacterium]
MKSIEITMKKVYKWLLILTIIFLTNLSAQVASVTWPLTSNQNPNTPIGSITASPEIISAGSPFLSTGAAANLMTIYGYNSFNNSGQELWVGNQGGTWVADPPAPATPLLDPLRFIQFNTAPTAGNNFTVTNISFKYGDDNNGFTNFNILAFKASYSINGFQTETFLNTNPLVYLNLTMSTFTAQNLNVIVPSGQTFSLRIYMYPVLRGIAMARTFAIHKDVIIEGRTSPADLNNGSICGMKFWDFFPNGIKDESELLLGLSGWTITLTMGAVQMTAITGTNGAYCFNNLPAGTYTLTETPQDGWLQTFPPSPGVHTITLAAGQSVDNIDFGNKRLLGSISGTKFNDVNGTGDQQYSNEPGLPNWTINLTGPVTTSTTTDANGLYHFDNLPAGTYTVTETNQTGWQQIYPFSPGSYTVVLSAGEIVISKNFANQIIPPKLGSICGMKFNDLNGDGDKDEGEPGLQGWTINLTMGAVQMTATTGADGSYCFNNLAAGTYTLSETPLEGWQQTYPASPGTHTITITADLNLIGIDFGNKEILNPNCTDFENNSLNGWQANNISTSFQQNGNNHYIQTNDQAGVSTFYTTSKPFTGNWTSLFSNGCGSLCFDVNFIYGGDIYNGVTPPQTLTPYIALEGAGFKASFVVTQSISVGDGWHSYCAPLSFLNSDGTLPSNSDGYWIMTLGTASDWNTLLTNVTKVRLLADPTSYQNEKIGYDNICLKNTGDCNSPTRLGSICGIKIHDKDGDGIKDLNEDGIPNWTITIASGTTTYTATTDANGEYCFNNLPAGTYTISEEHRTGWRQVFPPNPGVHTITLLAGQNITSINFSNVEDITIRLGSICGIKFNDINGDGDQDPGELGLPNWTFQLSGVSNQTATTDFNGGFCFTNLSPGDYTITEVIQDGWQPTAPNSSGIYSVTLLPGENLSNIAFGNKEKLGSICGVKYNDLNGNGKKDDGEPFLSGWQISISAWGYTASGHTSGPTLTEIKVVTTDRNGVFCFDNLKPGSYLVGEYHQSGWTQTEPSTFAYSITLTPGQFIEGLNFGNKVDLTSKVGSICGIKFNDKNGDGDQDLGELGIADWQINLGGPIDMSVRTDKEGHFCFENLIPGEYKVGEEARSGWRQTFPATNFYIIQLASGELRNDINFGNTIDDKVQLGSICGTKFNDKNRDGRQVSGELGIANWTIYLEGPMNLTAVTDDSGNFCFYGLIPGTYTVREQNKTGWRQTKPSSITYTLEVGNGTNFTGIDFGNTEDPTVTLGSICGIKFNDLNGDGKKQDNEPGISNWTINLSGTMNLTVRTDARGKFCFENLKFGNYTLFESMKDGWKPTVPTSGSYTFELSEDNSHPDIFYFGNKEDISIRNGSICGMKYLDKNGDGKKDLTEPGIADWQINISGPVDRSIKTDKDGKFCFDDLPPGTYTIKEEPRTDWVQTDPASPGSYTVVLTSGQQLTGYYFGNKYEPKVGCVDPPSNMVAWWSLDYSALGARQDFAGFNNSGTMINGPLQVAGKVLGALQFDGVDDYVEVADHMELNFGTENFSFDAWIKTTDAQGVKIILDKRVEINGNFLAYKGYSIFLGDGKLALQIGDGAPEFDSYTNYGSTLFVADGIWHHIAITVSRSNSQGILFYLDGVPTQFGNPTSHLGSLTNTSPLRIGSQSFIGVFSGIGKFKGILDEIELFKRVLTPAEVLAIYNAGSAGKCKPNSNGGSVSGNVWHDLNHNGVKDPTEVSLEQWEVLLNGPTIVQTETDENGNFHFYDLKPGDYTLSVAYQNDWSCTYPLGGRHPFKLEEAQTIDGLYFGFADDPCLSGNKTWFPLGSGLGGGVTCLATDGLNLYAGGYFLTTGNNQTVNHIAKWNGQSWSPLVGSNGDVGVNGNVFAIAVSGNKVYVGGEFSSAGGVTANSIAMWDGISWSSLTSTNGVNGVSSSVNPKVLSLAVSGNELYVGGLFASAGGITANNIAKWNGSNWSAVGNGFDNAVTSLAVIGTDIFAGGFFEHSGNLLINKIAKWNGTNWLSLNNGVDNNVWNIMNLAWVHAMATEGNQIYAGGTFEVADGLWANNIAKWNGSSWSALGLGSGGVDSDVMALAFMGGNLYTGGNFTNTNPANPSASVSANRIAKWDGSNWSALGSGMFGNSGCSVAALAVIGDDLYAAGTFYSAGGVYANNIAKYSCSGNLTSIGDDNSNYTLPQQFELSQNYPNPFNPTSTIRYNIASAGFVKISVYDILGREIRVLVNEEKSPGHYEVQFDAGNLSSGVYFYTIRTRDYSQSKKMILLK